MCILLCLVNWCNFDGEKCSQKFTHTIKQFALSIQLPANSHWIWLALYADHLHFLKRGKPTNYQFYRRRNNAALFYIRQMLWKVGYPHLPWLFSKIELSTFDLSQTTINWMLCYSETQFSSKWQLGPLKKTGAKC